MMTSEKGIELIKGFEGCVLHAYQDAVGVWTIGWGTTSSDVAITGQQIRKGMEISQETADRWLVDSVRQKYEPLVRMYDNSYGWNQNEFDALVSFAYNIGSIRGLTANGTRTRAVIAQKWPEYCYAGGKRLEGLAKRREKELALFLTPVDAGRTSGELDKFVEFVESKLGTPYVYGSHGEVLTEEQLRSWAAAYPNVYTGSYIAKARQYVGQRCCDCAGLIDWYLGKDQNAQYYRDTATEQIGIAEVTDEHIGWAVWKPGHIGIYIGDGKVVEARGIDYGTVKTELYARPWQECCKLKDIQYDGSEREQYPRWIHVGDLWYYRLGPGQNAHGWRVINGHWYYFDEKGRMLTGAQEINGAVYYLQESGPLEGACCKTDDTGALSPWHL